MYISTIGCLNFRRQQRTDYGFMQRLTFTDKSDTMTVSYRKWLRKEGTTLWQIQL